MKYLKKYKFLVTYDVVEIMTVNGIYEAGLTHQVKEFFEIKAHGRINAELILKAVILDSYSDWKKYIRIIKCELKEVTNDV